LKKDQQIHFFTGTSAPCLSIFKPVSFDMDINFIVLNSDEKTVDGSVWKNHEHVHRRLLFLEHDQQQVRESIKDAERRMVEFFEKKDDAINFRTADQIVSDLEEQLVQKYRNQPVKYPMSSYGLYWKWMNRLDGFNYFSEPFNGSEN
jgi:hypothetical protein